MVARDGLGHDIFTIDNLLGSFSVVLLIDVANLILSHISFVNA